MPTRIRVKRVHDSMLGMVWTWTSQPFVPGAWGWAKDPGEAADKGRRYLKETQA